MFKNWHSNFVGVLKNWHSNFVGVLKNWHSNFVGVLTDVMKNCDTVYRFFNATLKDCDFPNE